MAASRRKRDPGLQEPGPPWRVRRACRGALLDGPREVVQGPYPSYLLDSFGTRKGEARRVVAPVLQVPETLHEDLYRPLPSNITDDPAHMPRPPLLRRHPPRRPPTSGRGRSAGRTTRTRARPTPGTRPALCPRCHHRALTPPLRPSLGRDAPAENSINVYLVDSRLLPAEALALVDLPLRKPRRSRRIYRAETTPLPVGLCNPPSPADNAGHCTLEKARGIASP